MEGFVGKGEGGIVSFRWVGEVDEIIAGFVWLSRTIWALRQNIFVELQFIDTIAVPPRSCIIVLGSATAI